MKPFSKIELRRVPKLSDQVVDFLKSEINKGVLAPGEYLPSEAELSAQFGVSRTVIREALGKLQYDGLLESSQGSKSRISKSGAKRVFRMEELDFVNLDEMLYLYEFRAIIESEASALAAKRRDGRDLEDMKNLIKDLEKAVKLKADGTSTNIEFHKAVVRASKNVFMTSFMNFFSGKIFDLVQSDRRHSKHVGLPRNVQNEHVSIFEAISAGDSKRARNETLKHLKNAAKRRGLKLFSKNVA
ncbi:MAG: FadR family transcriptional regulator [Deltaproteobacteria bacterium]|nr:FadR family transcriptional regulator [Deltaproteobacteria bacterium]